MRFFLVGRLLTQFFSDKKGVPTSLFIFIFISIPPGRG